MFFGGSVVACQAGRILVSLSVLAMSAHGDRQLCCPRSPLTSIAHNATADRHTSTTCYGPLSFAHSSRASTETLPAAVPTHLAAHVPYMHCCITCRRYEQERARNSRLRRVLRCAPQYPSNSLSMARSLTSTPNALRGTSSALYPNVSTAVDAELSAQQHLLQEEAAGASACRRRSSSDAKSPLSPQRQPQQEEQQISNAGTSSSPTCPIQQQQPQSFTQQRQTLRPLKCVPEGDSTSSSSSGLHPGSTSTPPAHISTSTATETTSADQGSATAATAAPAGSGSPSADPFAHYDGGPVSDPGEPFRLQPRSSDSGPPPAYPQQLSDTSTAGTTLSPAAAAAAVPAFRRTQTMPVGGSLSAVQSPSFAAGWGPGSFLHQAASWLPPMGGQSSGDKTNGRHTVDQLLRVMMAFTLMQGTTGAQDVHGIN